MADTRINALSTATSSVSDDFVPIDGTTNGTRKLSAYSPTFGGNATVGGTLTVTGATTLGGRLNAFGTTAALTHQVYVYNQLASATNAALSGAQYLAQPGYSTFVGTTGNGTSASYQGSIIGSAVMAEQGYVISDAVRGLLLHGINGGIKFATNNPGTQAGSISNAGVWTIDATTASTSTSSGALVVSGGVGVAGAINAGGAVNAQGILSTSNAAGVAVVGGRQWSIRANSSGGSPPSAFVIRDDSLGSERVTIDASGNIAALSTTASTSSSSGALVVSGGVGVAKRIFTGEGLDTAGDNSTHISFVRNGTVSIGPDSAATPALVVSTAIKTSAPSGGTAANWKLGTVATVSPTSPNRTIEVEIGGTTYYLHAKTTNN